MDVADRTVQHWLYSVGKENWEHLLQLRLADRRGNRQKAQRPLETPAFISLKNQIQSIVNSDTLVFVEDLNILNADLSSIPIKKRSIAIPNMIGLSNLDSARNTPEYWHEHCRKLNEKR